MYYVVIIMFILFSKNIKAKSIDLNESMERLSKNSSSIEEIDKIRLENYAEKMDGNKLEDIEVEFSHNIEGKDGEFIITQPFKISDISLAKSKYRKNINKINDLEKEIDELRLHHLFLTSYYDLYILQEQKETIETKLRFLEKAKSVILKSINRNGMSQSEILAFDADILNTKTDLIELKNNFRKMQLQFLQSLNLGFQNLILKKPDEIKIEISLEDLLNRLDGYPSYYKLLLLKHNEAKYERKIFQQDRIISSISPQVGYGYDNFEKTDDFNFGITLTIPLWNRQNNKYAELKTNEKYIQKQLKAFDNISFQDIVKNIYDQLLDQIEIVKEYQNNIIPLYQKSIDRVEDNFLNGQVSILDVWEIRDKYAQAKLQMLSAMKSVLEIKNELELLIGNKMENLK